MLRRARVPSHSPLYQSYMRSTTWRQRRQLARARAGARCEQRVFGGLFRCRQRRGLSVHHVGSSRTAYRFLEDPRAPEQLKVLCAHHHRQADLRRQRGGSSGIGLRVVAIVAGAVVASLHGGTLIGLGLIIGAVFWAGPR